MVARKLFDRYSTWREATQPLLWLFAFSVFCLFLLLYYFDKITRRGWCNNAKTH